MKDAKILLLGITFKENCPDIRNTKIVDIYSTLSEYTKTLQYMIRGRTLLKFTMNMVFFLQKTLWKSCVGNLTLLC